MRKAVLFLLVLVGFALLLAGNFGCANIVPPAGGPRDSLPPLLLRSDPPDSTVNFRGKEIVLYFDEYVNLKDQNNILYTPSFSQPPRTQVQPRSIRIRFEEALDSNTTYVINFGNSIVDINEGNPLPDFVYSFSTGPVMDSLEISGRVVLAETGAIDSTLMVILHRSLEDSAVITDNPRYMVRLNQDGEFRFRYLPLDTFAIYAVDNAGLRGKYTARSQLFAFADAPVVAGQSDSLLLYAYREAPKTAPGTGLPSAPSPGRANGSDRRLRMTLPQGAQDLQSDYVISFPVPLRAFDSSRMQLSVDSSFEPVDFSAFLDSSGAELRISSQWRQNASYNLVLDQDFATDTSGRQLLKTDTVFFNTKAAADYGTLLVRLQDLDLSRNPVLQLVQNNQVVFSAPVPEGTLSIAMFNPGEYSLRILYDTNGNGKWDPGSFFGEKRQPEIVHPLSRTITVKPNWDNEFDIAL